MPPRFVACTSAMIAFAIALASVAPVEADPTATVGNGHVIPIVSTVAGNGSIGTTNGAALQSSFIEPAGIAVALDGSLYVSDASAHQVRKVTNGIVSLIAGNSAEGKTSLSRTGGYADGRATEAKFNRPMGLTISKDGAIYVADSNNHCIRKIYRGMVSTVAGSLTAGSADGPASSATFNTPLSIAIDDDGNLYVADFNNGIRKISSGGIVSTLQLPSGEDKRVFGVAARGSGEHLELAWSANHFTYFSARNKIESAADQGDREPTGEGLKVGNSDSLAIVGANSVVATDLINNCVKFIQFNTYKLDTAIMTRALIGGIREGSGDMGGYKDGASSIALIDVPLGIAVGPNGDIFVTDGGNRRIRRISKFDTRGPLLDDLSNLVGPANTYKIVVLGNSITFNNVLWGESIAGQIEAGLRRDAVPLGLNQEAYATTVRIDASSITAQREFIDNYLSDGQADLVVLLINPFSHNTELAARPDLALDDKWKSVIPEEIRAVDKRLADADTKFAIAIFPQGQYISPAEVSGKALTDLGLATTDEEIAGRIAVMHDFGRTYATSGVKAIDMVQAMIDAEASPNRLPFFNTADIHLTVTGSIWVGRHILAAIEDWRPWNTVRSKN